MIPYSPLACGFLTGKYRRGANVESIRAAEVRELYANERGFALIDQLETIGRTHGKTVSQTALAWLLTNPVVTAPIIGANTAAQLQESLGAAGLPAQRCRDGVAARAHQTLPEELASNLGRKPCPAPGGSARKALLSVGPDGPLRRDRELKVAALKGTHIDPPCWCRLLGGGGKPV